MNKKKQKSERKNTIQDRWQPTVFCSLTGEVINACVLQLPDVMKTLNVSREAAAKMTVLAIPRDVMPAAQSMAKTMALRWAKKRGFDFVNNDDIANKTLGILGDIALTTALNQADVKYKFDHHLAHSEEDSLPYDFILEKSNATIEVKTTKANTWHFIMKKRLHDFEVRMNGPPTVVISLKIDETTDPDRILFHFMGWLDGKSVQKLEHDRDACNKPPCIYNKPLCYETSPCYACRFNELDQRKVDDIIGLLKELSRGNLP